MKRPSHWIYSIKRRFLWCLEIFISKTEVCNRIFSFFLSSLKCQERFKAKFWNVTRWICVYYMMKGIITMATISSQQKQKSFSPRLNGRRWELESSTKQWELALRSWEYERSLKNKDHLSMRSKDPDYFEDVGSTYCCSRLGKDVREFPHFDPSTLGTLPSFTLYCRIPGAF